MKVHLGTLIATPVRTPTRRNRDLATLEQVEQRDTAIDTYIRRDMEPVIRATEATLQELANTCTALHADIAALRTRYDAQLHVRLARWVRGLFA